MAFSTGFGRPLNFVVEFNDTISNNVCPQFSGINSCKPQ